jgi:hypothetical protein
MVRVHQTRKRIYVIASALHSFSFLKNPQRHSNLRNSFFLFLNLTERFWTFRFALLRETEGLPHTHSRIYIYIHRIYIYMHGLLKKTKKRSLCQASFYRFLLYRLSSCPFFCSPIYEENNKTQKKVEGRKKKILLRMTQ